MAITTIPGFQLPFSKIHLNEISQKILIHLVSILKPLKLDEIKNIINFNDDKIILMALQELIRKSYVEIVDNDKYFLKLTQNEIEVIHFINTDYFDYLDKKFIDHEFTIPLILEYFIHFLITHYRGNHDFSDQKKLKTAVYKQLERAFTKFKDFKFLTVKKVDNNLIFSINVNFFNHTSKILKIAYYLNLSLNEMKNHLLNDQKIKDLSIHNLNLYYLDTNDDKIDYYKLGLAIQKNLEKDWSIDKTQNGRPIHYNGSCRYGDFQITIYEGISQKHPSMKILICQDKIKHAIPLTRLPYLIGHINNFLNQQNHFYFKDIDLEEFDVSMVHYNLDFAMKDCKKYELYMKEVGKELTLGSYTNHFLFRFYQLVGDNYRLESQVTKNQIPIKVKNVLNGNETDPVFKTVRGLFKQCIDLVNDAIEEEKLLTKIFDLQVNSNENIQDIKHQLRDYGSYTIGKVKSIDKSMDGFTNALNAFNLNQGIQNTRLDDIDIEVRGNAGLVQTSISEISGLRQDHQGGLKGITAVFQKVIDLMDDNKNFLMNNINKTDSKLDNFKIYMDFQLNFMSKCDDKTRRILNKVFDGIELDFPRSDLKLILKRIKKNTEPKTRFGKTFITLKKNWNKKELGLS